TNKSRSTADRRKRNERQRRRGKAHALLRDDQAAVVHRPRSPSSSDESYRHCVHHRTNRYPPSVHPRQTLGHQANHREQKDPPEDTGHVEHGLHYCSLSSSAGSSRVQYRSTHGESSSTRTAYAVTLSPSSGTASPG